MQLKSLVFVAVIKAVVAGEMDPKCAVDLSVSTNQNPDSKQVVSSGGHGDPRSQARVKMKGCGGDERGEERS